MQKHCSAHGPCCYQNKYRQQSQADREMLRRSKLLGKSRGFNTASNTPWGTCVTSGFLEKCASITVVDLFQQKNWVPGSFCESNLVEVRFEIYLYRSIRIMMVVPCIICLMSYCGAQLVWNFLYYRNNFELCIGVFYRPPTCYFFYFSIIIQNLIFLNL